MSVSLRKRTWPHFSWIPRHNAQHKTLAGGVWGIEWNQMLSQILHLSAEKFKQMFTYRSSVAQHTLWNKRKGKVGRVLTTSNRKMRLERKTEDMLPAPSPLFFTVSNFGQAWGCPTACSDQAEIKLSTQLFSRKLPPGQVNCLQPGISLLTIILWHLMLLKAHTAVHGVTESDTTEQLNWLNWKLILSHCKGLRSLVQVHKPCSQNI